MSKTAERPNQWRWGITYNKTCMWNKGIYVQFFQKRDFIYYILGYLFSKIKD